MKAILSYPLYRRSKATNEEEATGYLAAGSVIEVINVTPGKLLDGISIWFYSDDGFYYWGGGIEFSDNAVFADWNGLDEEMQKALLDSLVADDLFWFQKKVIGYVGCGWGYKNNQVNRGLALSIFVVKKDASSNFGSTVLYKGYNVPVDVKETGILRHHAYSSPPLIQLRPDIDDLVGGSICVEGDKNSYGTRSICLFSQDGKRYLMTCFHVLLNPYKEQGKYPNTNSEPVFAEAPSKARKPGIKGRFNLKVIEGKYDGCFDYAIVELPPGSEYLNKVNQRTFLDYYRISELNSLIKKTVSLVGATSNYQTGIVNDVRGSITVNANHTCSNVVVAERLSTGGDSGAPVIDDSGKLVGIVVSGDDSNMTLILPVSYFFSNSNYSLTKPN